LYANVAVAAAIAGMRAYADRSGFRPYSDDLANYSLLTRDVVEAGFRFGLQNDWLNGAGGLTFHWNPFLQPEMMLGMVAREQFEVALSTFALMLGAFLATLLLARSLDLSANRALAAAWIVMAMLPQRFYPLMTYEPPYATSLILSALILSFVALSRRAGSRRFRVMLELAAAVVFALMVVIRPIAWYLVLPALLPTLIGILLVGRETPRRDPYADTHREFLHLARIATWSLVGVTLLYASTFLPTIYYTAANLSDTVQWYDRGLAAFLRGFVPVDLITIPELSAPGIGMVRELASFAMVAFRANAAWVMLVVALLGAAGAVTRTRTLSSTTAVGFLASVLMIIVLAAGAPLVGISINPQYFAFYLLPMAAIMATGVPFAAIRLLTRQARANPAATPSHANGTAT
jgi:hypothetical protein